MLNSMTKADFLHLRPYYGQDVVDTMMAGRARVTALDIMRSSMDSSDKLWTLASTNLVPASLMDKHAEKIALMAIESALRAGVVIDRRCTTAMQAKRDWRAGKGTIKALTMLCLDLQRTTYDKRLSEETRYVADVVEGACEPRAHGAYWSAAVRYCAGLPGSNHELTAAHETWKYANICRLMLLDLVDMEAAVAVAV